MIAKRNKTDEAGEFLDTEERDEPHPDEVAELPDAPESIDPADLPESLTIAVNLPAPVHDAPEDELAVAIDVVPVDPGRLAGQGANTTSIEVVTGPVVQQEDPPAEGAAETHADNGGQSAYSRRDRLRGEVSDTPEPAAMLTADRLLDAKKRKRPRPEGGWNEFVYLLTLGIVNLGDSAKVRERKRLDMRIDKAFEGGTRFVPVLTRKGGVGKTTVTALLGMALAYAREDRVIAIDANPDRGTLAERVSKQTRFTVRDVVTKAASITSFSDLTPLVVPRRDPAGHPGLRHRPDAVRGVRRERLQRRGRPHRAVLFDRAHRLRHRHRALGHAGHPAARGLGGDRLRRQRRRSQARLRDPHLAGGQRLRRPGAQRGRGAQHRDAGHQPGEARGDRSPLQVQGARDRAHPYDPATGRRFGHRLRGTEASSPRARPGNWPRS